jgi:GH24 family phage-related lysozyme (muramidase)
MSAIQLRSAAKHFKELPHQLAAWDWLQGKLSDEVLKEFAELYRADPLQKQPLAPAWLAPALRLIRKWEGCRLEAYKCPAGVPTIGYGATRFIDRAVRMGDKITQDMAEELLQNEVENLFAPGVFALLPMAKTWRPEQTAAIISFAYNVGLGALEESTLRKRLFNKEDPVKVVIEELPRWNKADGKILQGLVNRRKDEIDLFVGARPIPANAPKPHLLLTRTGKLDARGLEQLKLEYIKGGESIGSLLVVSGAPGAQQFRVGARSRAGSLEPLPEGRWGIEDIEWASGKDNYSGSWGPGLGPVSTPLRYLGPGGTERSAIEIHIDSNARTSPGTAGCIGIANEADYRKLVSWLRDSDPHDLFVDYKLGTCPQPK